MNWSNHTFCTDINIWSQFGFATTMYLTVGLKIRTMCHARDLWKWARSWEKFMFTVPTRPVKFTRYCLTQWIWNQFSKTIFSKCSFMSNKGHVNILNDRKARAWFVSWACKYFPLFWHCDSIIAGLFTNRVPIYWNDLTSFKTGVINHNHCLSGMCLLLHAPT